MTNTRTQRIKKFLQFNKARLALMWLLLPRRKEIRLLWLIEEYQRQGWLCQDDYVIALQLDSDQRRPTEKQLELYQRVAEATLRDLDTNTDWEKEQLQKEQEAA